MNNHCPDSSELLSLALGQISKYRSDVLEAHLANCPHCQQEYTALVQLRSAVREKAPRVPDGLAERTWSRLPERKVLPRWRPLVIGTSTAALGGVLILTLLPGMPLQPTAAFAQVKQAMDKVDTATWNETFYSTTPNGSEEKLVSRECWAQVSSARLAYQFKGVSNVTKIIVNGERLWDISLQHRHWRLVDAWGGQRQFFPNASASELVRQVILFPRDPASWQERKNTALPSAYASQGEVLSAWKMERDGELLCFRRKRTTAAPSQLIEGTETVWVKPDTYRIVRRELINHIPVSHSKTPGVMTSRTVCDNYRYDLTPPAEIFTIPLPEPGKPYVFTNMLREQKLPSRKDTEAVRRTLARAAAAWNRKDVNAFLACWDWKSYLLAEMARSGRSQTQIAEEMREEQNKWRTLVTHGRPFPRWEVKSLGPVATGTGVYTRSSVGTPFPPLTIPPNGLGANGTARIEGIQEQDLRVSISARLQRQPNGEFLLTNFALSPRHRARL